MRITIVLFFALLFCADGFGQTIIISGDTTFCEGGSVELSVSPDTSIKGFQWIFGTTAIPNQTFPNYTAKFTGEYKVRVKRTPLADTIIGPVTVTVKVKPIVKVNSPSICNGQSTVLKASGADTYAWSPPEGLNTIEGESVIATPTLTKTYTVIGTNAVGCLDTVTSTVTVNPNPVSNFTFPSAIQCSNIPIIFTNTSIGGSSYSWNFGDINSGKDNISTAQNPSHRFIGTAGNGNQDFDVILTTQSSAGCSATKTLKVTNTQLPDGTLGGTGRVVYNEAIYFKTCGFASGDFTFTNQSTTAETNKSYRIIWGDNSTDFNALTFLSTTHTYSIGSHSILFIVTGNNGCIDTSRYFAFVGTNPAVGLNNPGNTLACSGESLTFPISGTATNAPGTLYTVTFNDGTLPIFYIHPNIPSSITHVFNTTSCGTTSSNGTNTYNNSFSANIVAENPCASSAATIVPIYISKKPKAAFLIMPKDTVCINTEIELTNTSESNYVDNGKCLNGNSIWSISPTTGWTISSGNLGNDFGQVDPSVWQSASTELSLNFNQPGVYTIKIKTGNTNCGIDEIIKTICVTPPPIPAFDLNNINGCIPLNVIATNTTSSLFSCKQPTYKWTIDVYTSSFCGTSPAFTFTNGTTDTSANPSFSFTNPGTYTITQNVTNACGTFTAGKTITVRDKLAATIIAPLNACINEPVLPKPSFNCYSGPASYAWSFPGGSTGSPNDSIPGSITYSAAGNYIISLNVTNECGTTTATKPIVINTVTIADAGAAQNICGSTITMAANTPTTGTGKWTKISGPENFTINDPSSPATTITGVVTGTYVFRWTITNQTCISSSEVTIIISPGASVAIAGPDQDLCLSTSTTLNATAPAIGTGSWTQSTGPNTVTFNTPSANTTTVSGLIPGVYVFTWTVIFSNCPPTKDDVQVTVYDNPSAASAGADQTICTATDTLAGNRPAIGTGTWSQVGNLPNTAVIDNIASPSAIISGLIPGGYTFVWTITNGPCAAVHDTVKINVTDAATIANAGADIDICTGTVINLAGNAASVGTGVWTTVNGPAGAIITDPALPNTGIIGLIPGIYTFRWTITNGNCPPSADEVQVTVYDNPSVANAGTGDTICAASASLFANIPVIGKGTWSQVGNLPGSAVISDPSSPSTTVSGLIPGIYKFQWTIINGPCTSSHDTMEISVTEIATTANAGVDIRACAVSTINLSGNAAVVGTGVWTMLSGPAGAVITNTSSPVTIVTNMVPGTYLFRWTITNGNCPPSTDDVQVIIDENVTVANAGPSQNICGTSATMAANSPAIGTGIWTYVSGSPGYVIDNPGSPATIMSGLVPGTYIFRWSITNGSCISSADVTIIISAGASIADAGADQELCLSTSTSLTGNTPSVGTGVWSYISGPAGAVITVPNTPSTTVTALEPGKYIFRYTISFSNCAVNTDEVQVVVYDNPSASNAGADDTICTTGYTFKANAPSIGNGSWSQISGPNTANIQDPVSPVSAVSSLVPGIYKFKWTITNGPCATNQDTVEINVSAAATISDAGADQTYCALPAINLLANVPLTGTGLWSTLSGPNTPVIATPAINSTAVTGLVPGIYTFSWIITNGVCPPSTDNVTVIILNNLQNTITAPITTICSGQLINISGEIPSGGNGTYIYQWQQSTDGNTWTDVTGENGQNFSGILTATRYFRRKVTSLPCETFSNITEITVQPGISNNAISFNDSICINTQPPAITGSSPTGGDGIYFYQWQQSIDAGIVWKNIAGETGNNYQPGVLTQTIQYRRLVNTSLCSGPQSNISNIVVITINPDSKAAFIASPTISCSQFALAPAISITSYPDRNLLYNWYADDSLFGSNTTGIFPGYTITNPGDTVIIKLVTTSQFGCKPDSTEQQFITIKTAVAAFTKDTSGGCGPLKVNFTNTSDIINPGIQFFWNFGNGITSTQAQPGAVTFLQSPFFNDTTYQITLKAYNGCDTTIWRDSVKIRTNPQARFGIDKTSGCSPFPVHLTNNSLGGPSTYYWDFGNGHKDTTSGNGILDYTYNIGNMVDTFLIRLIAVNECASDTTSIDVRIAPNAIKPQITISGSDLFGCTPHIVSFNNASIGATSFTWDYGDGTTPEVTNNSQSIVTHMFNTPGIFNVAIRMTNGCSDTTVYRQVTVFAKPIADFTTTTSVYCLGDTVRVINNSLNASNYSWFWGDGQSNTDPDPKHLYTAAGNYTLLLRAEKTNTSGAVCSDTMVKNITILVKPDVRVQTNVTNINCTPFTLNATAPGIINESVTWYISDTAVSTADIVQTGLSMQYRFNKPGTFSIKMVALNASGCKDSTINTFIVRGTPATDFTPLNITLCKTDTTVSYLNTTTFNDNGPLNYKWLTNGALQSTNGNFSYRYIPPANSVLPITFTTQLIATNAVGCSDTATGILQMNPAAKAQFSISNATDCVPFNTSVSNTSEYSSTYKWLLNGVLIDTAFNPTIRISQSLTQYTITLIAGNNYGCVPDTFSTNFTSRVKPVAAFALNDTLGCSGILNIVTTNQSGNAASYQWDWGDNSANSAFTSPTHLYNFTGRYLITLVASDGVCKDTTNKLVTVATKPVVNFSADDTLTCDTARIHFTNLTRNAERYLWIFSDGTSSSAPDPVKTFAPNDLYYSVKLVAFNIAGCKDSLTRSNLILARKPPAADFLISPSPVITVPDYTFTFNNLTLNSNKYTYLWSLGDGAFAGTRDVTHKYADTGSYQVRLIVLDTSTGCPDTIIKIALINGYPGYLYVPNAFYPNSQRNEFKTFKPLGKGLAADGYRLQVFDSWGKLVFETRKVDAAGGPAEGWDGTDTNGKPLPQDAYAWRITARFKSGKQWDGMSYNNKLSGKPGNTFGTLTLFR